MCDGCKQTALREAIAELERSYFRTVHDTGANEHAMLLMNALRGKAGLPRITLEDLPAWCEPCRNYHLPDQHKPSPALSGAMVTSVIEVKTEQEHLDSLVGQ